MPTQKVVYDVTQFYEIPNTIILCLAFCIVSCTELEPPEYALINCEFGNNRTPSYQDICHYTCESGFEPVGGISRTCLSNGTWSNVEVICQRG